MWKYSCVLVCVVVGLVLCIDIEHDFKGFDDSILFGINWPGVSESVENHVQDDNNKPKNKEIIKVKTQDQEQYECRLPELEKNVTTSSEEYDGPTPMKLLKPLFSQNICSYRLESYWSYEVCHGRYIKQYHDERDGKQQKVQEYYLGFWNSEKHLKLENEMKAAQEAKLPVKTTKVERVALPSIEIVMDDGSFCDLSGKPRVTRVQYVCYTQGKHEVYSFKETSTCEYEIIILSPLLCEHPQFKPADVSENAIECLPVGDAPKRPRGLLKMEVDTLRFQHQSIRLANSDKDRDLKEMLAVLKVEKIEKDGETHLKFELQPLNEVDEVTEGGAKIAIVEEHPVTDDSPVRAFLNGEDCLHGGTGWWKYEFCYGRHVVQYHVDLEGKRSTLLLGKFDEKAHLDWIADNKGKAPKPIEQRNSISHFYSGGDVCDKTGNPRQTEVKLKCLENSSSAAQVSLYLLEPRTCHYILGVESPLICNILPYADENGLIKSANPIFTKRYDVIDVKVENESEDKPKEEQKGND